MKKILPLFLLSILFTSCLWIPEEGFNQKCQTLLAKNSLKDFSLLEEPIIIRKGLYSDYNLALSPSIETENSMGNLYVIYDWKTDSFYDWCFVSKNKESVLGGGRLLTPCIGKDGTYLYADSDGYTDKIITMKSSPEPEISYISQKDKYQLLRNQNYKSKYVLTYLDNYFQTNIQIYNTEKNELQSSVILPQENYQWFSACPDPDGSFWISLRTDSDNIEIARFDSKNNCFEDSIKTYNTYEGYSKRENGDYENYDEYRLILADEKYIYLERCKIFGSAGNPYKIIALDKETGAESGVELPEEVQDNYSIVYLNKVNDKIYVVIQNYYEKLANIYTLNLESQTFTKLKDNVPFSGGTEIVERSGKLYFFYLHLKDLQYYIFDTSNNSLTDKKIVNYDEIINN